MPSPDDRLSELRHQRALVQEQLAWLDREIASAAGAATPAKPAAQSLPPVSAMPSQPAAPPTDGDDMNELIKSFEAESRSSLAQTKRGCIWIFVAALALLGLSLFAFYLYVSHHQASPVR
jgi:hypothetical protein